MIVLLDCNIWVTLSINRQLDFILRLTEKNIQLVSCQQLESEFLDVLTRPKLMKFLPAETIKLIFLVFKRNTTPYKIGNVPIVVDDPKDNYLFALCKKTNADYFVTGDKLLLNESRYGRTQIITLSQFRELMR